MASGTFVFEVRGKKSSERVRYEEPRHIGRFSTDGNRRYLRGKSNLKYLSLPKCLDIDPKFDLNVGYAISNKKDYALDEGLKFLLQWCLKHQRQLSGVEFVSHRWLLQFVMLAPYNKSGELNICATKFRGIIYIHSFYTAKDKERFDKETERDRLQSYWGTKFEYYVTTDAIGIPRDNNAPIETNAEFNSVLRARLNSRYLLFSAEIDALDQGCPPDYPDKTGKTDKYVELKTARIVQPGKEYGFKMYKLKDIWAQSFLVGGKKTYIGFRDDNGRIKRIDLYETNHIPAIANKDRKLWSPEVCVDALDKFLTFVKDTVKEDNPKVVYSFYWKFGEAIVPRKLENSKEFSILPEWYTINF